MPIELDVYMLNPQQFLGIPFALVGAVFLALGAQFQYRGVRRVEALTLEDLASSTVDESGGLIDEGLPAKKEGLNFRQLMRLLKRPSWVIGTSMLGAAVIFQLISITLAPLIVVQPLGAIALVITAVLNSRMAGITLNRATKLSILLCVGSVAVFVTIAAFTAVEVPVGEEDLITILILLGVVTVLYAAAFIFFRDRFAAVAYIIAAGILYGFVVTLAKVVISRFLAGDFEWLTLTCLICLIVAAALGGYFVQNAYATGPPDLVVAGLTVVDPIVAIAIGVVVLGEATFAPWPAIVAFIVVGAAGIIGVFSLARHHPQLRR